MIEEKINPLKTIKVELGTLPNQRVETLAIHKTPFRFAILLGGKPFTCYTQATDFGMVMQFGRLLIPCHSVDRRDDDKLMVMVNAFEAGRMVSYAASRKWDWRGGVDSVRTEFRAENGFRFAQALKTALAE